MKEYREENRMKKLSSKDERSGLRRSNVTIRAKGERNRSELKSNEKTGRKLIRFISGKSLNQI